MDYTDVIFQNDMDGAGFLDDAKVKAQELAAKTKEQAQKMRAKTLELTEKAKVEAKKRANELKAKTEEMWSNREAIMSKLSENAKVAYLEAEKNAKAALAKAKQEYDQIVEKLVPEVNKVVENIIVTSSEYKNLAEDKLEEVRVKLTEENLNKMRAEAEKKFTNAVNEVNKKLNEVIQGGDYYSKYLKYKAKYLALKKEVNQ